MVKIGNGESVFTRQVIGYWLVSKFANPSVTETLKALTIRETVTGLLAFALILLVSFFSNVLPGLMQC